ncbi:MAG: hypothetical protein ACJ8H8_11410 [Geminicoccaceae bacterium]
MARKSLFNIAEADASRPTHQPPVMQAAAPVAKPSTASATTSSAEAPVKRRHVYREGKRAVMFFLSEEAFSQMHVLLARQGRKKVQQLMEELVDDWFRRENAPRLVK